MTALPKIIIGALATTATAWFLHGPIGLGASCQSSARVSEVASSGNSILPAGGTIAGNGNAGEAAATPQAVAACQAKVSEAAGAAQINFATGGTAVAAGSTPLLDGIAAALRNCVGTVIEVGGYTDAQGDAATNQALSQRRAEAVAAELVKRGVPSERLTARGYGESKLLDPAGPENNPRERRIEVTVSGANGATAA